MFEVGGLEFGVQPVLRSPEIAGGEPVESVERGEAGRSAFSLSFVALAKKDDRHRVLDVGRWMLGVGLMVCLVSCHRHQEETRWTMINVTPGQVQADCHLIEFPDGSKVLIDIADAMDAPGTALAFLQNHKITHINLVIISHFHKDHYGRLRDLVNSGIKVDRVACNLPATRGEMDREHLSTPLADWDDAISVLQFLREKQIPYFTPKAGDRLIEVPLAHGLVAALDVVCLYDGVHTPIGETSINDTSIIVRLSHGPIRALFTGDLMSPLATWLADSNFDLAADVLKVQHHGAYWSGPDKFFARVNPKAALVPAPKGLWASLLDKRVRDYLSEHHIPTYVSGINGNVTVIMTTQGFTIQEEHPVPMTNEQ